MTKAIKKILWLRQFSLLEAKRDLALAIGRAEHADMRLDAARLTAATETRFTAQVPGEYMGVPWAAWLPIGQRGIALAAETAKRADTAKSLTQDQLALCRAQLRATETLVESQAERERLLKARKSQHQVEDVSRRSR